MHGKIGYQHKKVRSRSHPSIDSAFGCDQMCRLHSSFGTGILPIVYAVNLWHEELLSAKGGGEEMALLRAIAHRFRAKLAVAGLVHKCGTFGNVSNSIYLHSPWHFSGQK